MNLKLALLALVILLNGCATSSVSQKLAGDVSALPASVVLTGTPFFPQAKYQCGPAALATVLVYRHVDVKPDELTKRIYLPGRQGTLAADIMAEVRNNDLLPYPLAPNLHDLLVEVAAGNPVLVLQNLGLDWYPQWHYSVVIGYDINKQHLVSRSGTAARRITTFSNFENTWRRADHWALVIPSRDQLPATANMMTWLAGAQDLTATAHHAAARRAYQLASIKWPDSELPWFGLGNSDYQQQNFSAAESAFRSALVAKPQNPDAWNNLSYAMSKQGCQREAIAAANCSVMQAPQNMNSRNTLQQVSEQALPGRSPAHCRAVKCNNASVNNN